MLPKTFSSLLLPLLFGAALFGQPAVVEKIDVAIVNVDVTVTGADGKPVAALSRDDFTIFDDGRPQTMTNFYAVSSAAAAPSTAAGGTTAGPPLQEPRFRRRVFVLVDIFHTTKIRRALALTRLEKMIDDSFQTGEYDWSIGVLGRGVTMVLPLTSNKAAVHYVFEQMVKAGDRAAHAPAPDLGRQAEIPNLIPEFKLPSQPSSPADMNALIEGAMALDDSERVLRARFTTKAVIDALRGFASTPGKKIVLFLTGDIGLNDFSSSIDNDTGVFRTRDLNANLSERSREINDLRNALIQEANASGVSMYMFNVEGLDAGMDMGAAPKPPTNPSAIFWLAKETGGRVMTGNDAGADLRQFEAASSNYYSLGYRSPHSDDGKPHRIEVRLKNGIRAQLDYRSTYTSSPAEAQLGRAMQSPIAAALLPDAIPVKVVTGAAQPEKSRVVLPVNVRVPFSALQFLPATKGSSAHIRIYLAVFSDAGRSLFQGNFPLTLHFDGPVETNGTMVYKNAVVHNRGAAIQIVAAVRDEVTDAIGAATISVKSPE